MFHLSLMDLNPFQEGPKIQFYDLQNFPKDLKN